MTAPRHARPGRLRARPAPPPPELLPIGAAMLAADPAPGDDTAPMSRVLCIREADAAERLAAVRVDVTIAADSPAAADAAARLAALLTPALSRAWPPAGGP